MVAMIVMRLQLNKMAAHANLVINAIIVFLWGGVIVIGVMYRDIVLLNERIVSDVRNGICPGQARQGLVISVMGRSVPTERLVYRKVNKSKEGKEGIVIRSFEIQQ